MEKMNYWEMIEFMRQNPTKKAIDCNGHIISWKFNSFLYQDDKPLEIQMRNELTYIIYN